jgi:hypothetical protein
MPPKEFEDLGVSKLAFWGGSPKRAKNPHKRRISGKTEVANFACWGIYFYHNSRHPQKGTFLTLFGPPICKYLQRRGSLLELRTSLVFAKTLGNSFHRLRREIRASSVGHLCTPHTHIFANSQVFGLWGLISYTRLRQTVRKCGGGK